MYEQIKTELYIDGDWRAATDGGTFESLDPESDAVYAIAARATAEDVDTAVAAARVAAKTYGVSTPREREAWLHKAAALLEERRPRFIDALIDEIGSPLRKANFEFGAALDMMRASAGMTRRVNGEVLQSDVPGRMSFAIRRPVGVVAAITPFNVPLIKGVRLTANALAAGNTVVLLASEMAPGIASLLAEVYHDAGFPAGAFNLVTGFGAEIGDSLTGHPDVDFVTFTGSSVVGQHIAELCARHRRPNTLELGGKSPMVVLRDADLPKAIAAACHAIFTYQGQVCMGASRIYVERPVYDAFLDGFAAAVRTLGLGDLRDIATVVGPIISTRQRDRVRRHIEDAMAKGGTVVAGGKWHGNRCEPTILTGLTDAMMACREETFGPVTAVYPVADYDEALARANDTAYGLSSSIFTQNLKNALHFARNTGAGMCHVNGSALHDEPHVPFGGNGESGTGREGTVADLDSMTTWTWVTIQP